MGWMGVGLYPWRAAATQLADEWDRGPFYDFGVIDPSIEVSEAAASTPRLVSLFDEYREHYGERPDPDGARHGCVNT